MATDVDVQYFSHLNGLTLSNNWGDLIRLLDKALVTGIDFTQITAASIDEQGDVHITLYSAHNAMLFQVVEMTGFTPQSLNQRYRIKGVPNTTQLILKPKTEIVERAITTKGTGKLASLGYEIIFRDTNDVKRVYRAKNPTAQHPYIRVDETISDGVNSYNSAYAKYAMVGLLESMGHIDDYENPDVLQLPFDSIDPAKNWKIAGTGASVVRGWSRWHWNRAGSGYSNATDSEAPTSGSRPFVLCGDKDAFFLNIQIGGNAGFQTLRGCGLYKSNLDNDLTPPWFLCTYLTTNSAGVTSAGFAEYFAPLSINTNASKFLIPKYLQGVGVKHISATPLAYNLAPGIGNPFGGTDAPALSYPFMDADNYLRGTLPHVNYSGRQITSTPSPIQSGNSLYVGDAIGVDSAGRGTILFYLGELE
ncbi:hypothetical protein KTJ13_08635 [Acinetobacter radioresistens]|uniref:hypothetical protein n=1 Tax=Acinetobacter radioresistens TaxID=40216 RepID=UPI0021CDAE28|nr:hypothetical protein [Acinetobacter radioresistens]MCU4595927.1 hypothetical protein [Acinetobacter radioresistens]